MARTFLYWIGWSAFLIFITLAPAHARWKKESDAAAHFEEMNTTIKVNRDYSSETVTEFTAVVDKQTAVKDFTTVESHYSPLSGQVKILSAKTINNGQTFNVDPKLIEDKAIAGLPIGFDSIHQVRVSLPAVSIGAKVVVKIWAKSLPHPFPHFFSGTYNLDGSYPVRSSHFKMVSEVPINYRLNDPGHHFKVAETKTAKGLTVQLDSLSPIYQQVVDELSPAFKDPQPPILYVSTGSEWGEFGNRIADEYEKVLQSPLPVDFGSIASRAKAKTAL